MNTNHHHHHQIVATEKLKVGQEAIHQLNLKVTKGEGQKIDQYYLSLLLGPMLGYPSTRLAIQHNMANKLGNRDMKEEEEDSNLLLSDRPSNHSDSKPCHCCGLMPQTSQISLYGVSLPKNWGLSTQLYFSRILSICRITLYMMLCLGILLITTNIIASQIYQTSFDGHQPIDQLNTFSTIQQKASIGSKIQQYTHLNNIFCIIQSVFIMLFLLLMCWWLFVKNKDQLRNIANYEANTVTASSYTLKFTFINCGTSLKIFQPEDFKNLEKVLTNKIVGKNPKISVGLGENPIRMVKSLRIEDMNPTLINIVKDLQDIDENQDNITEKLRTLQQTHKQAKQQKNRIIQIIEHRKKTDQFAPKQTPSQIIALQNKCYELKCQKYKLITNILQEQGEKETTNTSEYVVCYVTFTSDWHRDIIFRELSVDVDSPIDLNQDIEIDAESMEIQAAPEPEDIIWENIYVPTRRRLFMRVLTILMTVIVLLVSFALTFWLTAVEIKEQTKILSIAIYYILLPFFNYMLSVSIEYFTKLEQWTTKTHEQTSIALKSIGAQVSNTLIMPFVVNWLLRANVYGKDGLTSEVFSQLISLAIWGPLLIIVNPKYWVLTRGKRWWYNRPWNKIYLTQKQLNKYFEEPEFELGSNYVQVIIMYLFCCFYATLQPLVIPFMIVGFGLFYLAKRVQILKYSCRPTQGNADIDSVILRIVQAGPLFLVIGNFFWAYSLAPVSYMPILNWIELGMGVVLCFFPFRYFAGNNLDESSTKKMRDGKFENDRIFFQTEYDRMYPLDSLQAQLEYKKYATNFLINLLQKQNNDDPASKAELEKLQDRLAVLNMCGPGQQIVDDYFGDLFFFDQPRVNVFIDGQNLNTIIDQFNQFLQKISNYSGIMRNMIPLKDRIQAKIQQTERKIIDMKYRRRQTEEIKRIDQNQILDNKYQIVEKRHKIHYANETYQQQLARKQLQKIKLLYAEASKKPQTPIIPLSFDVYIGDFNNQSAIFEDLNFDYVSYILQKQLDPSNENTTIPNFVTDG